MDGNNRWAKKNNFSKENSYKKGAMKLFKLSDFIFKNYKTMYISAFALSNSNLKRSASFLKIFTEICNFFIKEFDKYKFEYKINFIGDLTFLSKKIINDLRDIENSNKSSKYCLNIFLNYSGRNDIKEASIKLNGNIKSNLDKYLMTKNLPDPDILFRSGGYQRISDFMLYQISFTELYFSNKLWPDITCKDISNLYVKYSKTERKFGI